MWEPYRGLHDKYEGTLGRDESDPVFAQKCSALRSLNPNKEGVMNIERDVDYKVKTGYMTVGTTTGPMDFGVDLHISFGTVFF